MQSLKLTSRFIGSSLRTLGARPSPLSATLQTGSCIPCLPGSSTCQWRIPGRHLVTEASLGRSSLTATSPLNPATAGESGGAVARGAAQDPRNSDVLKVTLGTGRTLSYSVSWLRAHCQCPECFVGDSRARAVLMEDLQIADTVKSSEVSEDGQRLDIEWTSGHKSQFQTSWLLQRAFEKQAMEAHQHHYRLPKSLWSSDHTLKRFSYPALMSDDSALLGWLQELEEVGASLLTDVPPQPESANNLASRVGFPRRTYFGNRSNVHLTPKANNLAYTDKAMNMHTDLCYYEHLPGIVFLHMIKQHRGEGGATILSDAFLAADILRRNYPDQFSLLTRHNIYFQNVGVDRNSESGTPYEYHRITRTRTICLDAEGELEEIRLHNQTLDSFPGLPLEIARDYLAAMQLYYSIMDDNSIQLKLDDGQLVALDNTRCPHGRTGIVGRGERHLVTSYMAWDEARCMRRRLTERLSYSSSSN